LAQPSEAARRLDEHVLDRILDLVGAPVEAEKDGGHAPAVPPVDLVPREVPFVLLDEAQSDVG